MAPSTPMAARRRTWAMDDIPPDARIGWAGTPHQALDGLEVGLGERAIPGYVGVKKPPHTQALHTLHQLHGADGCALHPSPLSLLALPGHPPLLPPCHCQGPAPALHQIRVLHRRRPQHHPVHSQIQEPFPPCPSLLCHHQLEPACQPAWRWPLLHPGSPALRRRPRPGPPGAN